MAERFEPTPIPASEVVKETPFPSRAPDIKSAREFLPRDVEIRLGQQMDAGKKIVQKAQLVLKEKGVFLTDEQQASIKDEIAAGEKQRVAARDELVVSHLPLADMLARKYKRDTVEREDFVQDATEALVKAADRYDWTNDARFSTYATSVISGSLRHVLRDTRPIHISRGITKEYPAIMKTSEKLTHDLHREPTNQEIGREVQKTPEEVAVVFQAMKAEKYMGYYLTGSESEAHEVFKKPDSGANTEEQAILKVTVSRLIEQAGLDERSKLILQRRFYDGWTQEKIGKELGVRQMQVSRLETRALAKMRELLNLNTEE